MDIITIIGFVFGFATQIIGIMMDGDIMSFVDPTSIFLVFGGTIASTMIAFPLDLLKTIAPIYSIAFRNTPYDYNDDIEMIVSIANVARKEGLLALEETTKTMDNPFLKKGVMLIVDGSPPELVKSIMETDIAFTSDRHAKARDVVDVMADFAPAFGMAGTLIGLINMLKKLDDPSSLGPSMAVALVTTFYGVILANVVFKPVSKKLSIKSDYESFQKELLLEGILSIQDGENPRLIREKLSAFISKSSILAYEKKKGGGKSSPPQE